jgi:hypothetical protein
MLTGVGSIIEYFQATSVLPAPNAIETMYPQVIAATGGRFGVGYVNGFQFGYVDVWQAGVAGTPGPTPGPQPCTVQPGATTRSLTGAAQSQTISVTASTADCAWAATSSAAWITIVAGASGTGSGTMTFAVTRNGTGATRSGTINVGSGAVTVTQAPSLTNAAVHDISGDRASDLMWHNVGNGHVAVWNLVGHTVTDTYYVTNRNGAGVDTNWKVMGTGDLNGDGFADIVWRHSTGAVAAWFFEKGVIVSTQFLTLAEADPNWEIRAIGDLDGDGKSDIIWQNAGGTLGAWFMDGVTVRFPMFLSVFNPDPNWKIAGAGDLNADGKADLVWQNHATGAIAAWLLDGATVIGTRTLSIGQVPDLNWKIRGVGDTNGDGYADVLWQNISTGGLAVWYLNSFTVVATRWLSIGAVPDLNWTVVGPG